MHFFSEPNKEKGKTYVEYCNKDYKKAEQTRTTFDIPAIYLDTGLPTELSAHIRHSDEDNEKDKDHIMEILMKYKDNICNRSKTDYNLNEIEFINLQENLLYNALILGLCTALHYDKSSIIKAMVTEHKDILEKKADSIETDNTLNVIFAYYDHFLDLKDYNKFNSLNENLGFIIEELNIPRYALNKLESDIIQLNESRNTKNKNEYKIIFKILEANKKNKRR